MPNLFSLPPPNFSLSPTSNASKISLAPSLVCPRAVSSNLVRPSFSCKIVNTGMPLSASLLRSSKPNPPAVVLAYRSVMACNAPTLSALTLLTSPNNFNSSTVGSIPLAFSLITVLVRSSTLNTVSLANFLMSANT